MNELEELINKLPDDMKNGLNKGNCVKAIRKAALLGFDRALELVGESQISVATAYRIAEAREELS